MFKMSWTKESLTTHLANAETKSLVKFTAKWCGPCQRIHSELTQLVEAKKLEMIEIDVDNERELAEEWGMTSIPKMIVAIYGKQKEINGADVDGVARAIDELLLVHTSPENVTPIILASATINP